MIRVHEQVGQHGSRWTGAYGTPCDDGPGPRLFDDPDRRRFSSSSTHALSAPESASGWPAACDTPLIPGTSSGSAARLVNPRRGWVAPGSKLGVVIWGMRQSFARVPKRHRVRPRSVVWCAWSWSAI